MKFKAAIFDLDGTLLDTLADIANSMNHVLKHNGYPERPLSNYRYYVGEGIQALVYNCLEDIAVTAEEAQKLAQEMRETYHEHCMDETRPYDGINEMLMQLSAAGVQIGVLSNKPDEFTKKMVSTYFPEIPFSTVYGIRQGIPKKPDPAAVSEILDNWNVAAEETVFIGDSLIDMKTSVNAGTFPLGVLWGFRTRKELLANGAKALVNTPGEIVRLFGASF
jgi:phosphoglycolate phosphatase